MTVHLFRPVRETTATPIDRVSAAFCALRGRLQAAAPWGKQHRRSQQEIDAIRQERAQRKNVEDDDVVQMGAMTLEFHDNPHHGRGGLAL